VIPGKFCMVKGGSAISVGGSYQYPVALALRRTRCGGVELPKLDPNGLICWVANVQVLVAAFNLISKGDGVNTPGRTSDKLEGITLEKIHNIRRLLRQGKFEFDPARRVLIPKKCGDKLRPLDVIGQKVVQKAIAIALDILFEENISPYSHGFLHGKGNHSALKYIKDNFGGMTYNIEGDIKNCFGEIDHDILIHLLSIKISCPKFLKLVKKLITIGYIDPTTGLHCRVAKGVPQGCIPGPVLANIYLSCLDMYIENMIGRYNGKLPSGPSKAYWDVFNKAKRATDRVEAKRIRLHGYKDILSQFDYSNPDDFHLKYVRYADDFVVGVFGPESLALKIKEDIRLYLRNHLKLQLREEKTLITPGNKGFTFLNIKVQTRPKWLWPCKHGFYIKTTPVPFLYADMNSILINLSDKGFIKLRKSSSNT